MAKNNQFIYLDFAAATPLAPQVLKAMEPYFTDRFYNPSATYLMAADVRKDLNDSRAVIAELLGAKPAEIVFTAGATEANNLAIQGIAGKFPGKKIIVSSLEHDSVLKPAGKYNAALAAADKTGLVNLDDLLSKIDDDTVLVSIMYANNEIGTIQPLAKIAGWIKVIRRDRTNRGIRLPLYFHTDAAQAANYLDLHVSRLGVDLMSLNGGKIYGPKQTGVLFIGSKVQLEPLILGGGQERNLRSGTENVAGFIGLAEALKMVQDRRQEESQRLTKLQTLFIQSLMSKVNEVQVNGSLKNRLPNNVHVTFPGHDNERLLIELEIIGVLCAAGSACSASNEEPSHVLSAIGLSREAAQSSLRFSMGASTTEDEILKAVELITDAIKSS